MIPFIFITKDEFKKVIFFKYPLIKYVKMIFWYCLYAAAIYYIYKNPVSYFEDWNFPVAFIFLSSVLLNFCCGEMLWRWISSGIWLFISLNYKISWSMIDGMGVKKIEELFWVAMIKSNLVEKFSAKDGFSSWRKTM